MSWERFDPLSTYPKARRRELLRRIGRIVAGRPESSLLALEDVQDRLRSYEQSYIGVRSIRVDEIVGSVARSSDFDADFLPKSDRLAARWESLERRFPDGAFPPISVFKLGDAYFVADGHHRVAIAKQRKMDFLDAEVIEVNTPFEIDADTDVTRLVHLGQQRIFMDRSGLGAVRPEATFEFTRPEGYPELLDNVKVHGWDLMMSEGRFHSREEIAAHWYDAVYLPTIELIREADLADLIGDATEADVFLWVTNRWRQMFPEHGDLEFSQVIEQAADERSRTLRNKARAVADRVDEAVDGVVDRLTGRGNGAPSD